MSEIVTAIETRTAQTEKLAAYFAARPHQVLTHAELVREVGGADMRTRNGDDR